MSQQKQPRMRIFAGPNGSGKSSLKTVLRPELLGVYINPDEIEKEVKTSGFLDLSSYEVEANEQEVLEHFFASEFLKKEKINVDGLRFKDGKLDFSALSFNSYLASVVADFIRNKLMQNKVSFSFETVMSSQDKIALMIKAKDLGYKTYLYFIATDSPEINISRVKFRVSQGGHDVPQDKITSRYYRCLDFLFEAIKNSWRAYVFDNSQKGGNLKWLSESHEGKIIELKTDSIPVWFDKYVIQKLTKN